MDTVLDDTALPQRLQDLRCALHWVYGICWNEERNRFEVDDVQEFSARYERMKELLMDCSEEDLDDLAINISYHEIPCGSTREWCVARKTVFNALSQLQHSFRMGVL